MNPDAVEQSKRRLQTARKSATIMEAATSYEMLEDAWRDFLMAVSGIYSELEQGAKGNGKSDPWFGKKKNERKKDPLLSYLHFARNVEEHGLKRVTARTPHHQTIYITPEFNERRKLLLQKVDKKSGLHTGEEMDALIVGARVKCVRVIDGRFGDYRDALMEHFGERICCPELPAISGEDYVDILAKTALPYFVKLISDAEALI